MLNSRRYIGVDLGAWYGNKTRIAVLKKTENKLELVELINETKLTESWSSCNIDEKNRLLIECLKKQVGNSGVIGIDAPFAIPFYLHNKLPEIAESKPSYNLKEGNQKELKNPVLFDNSARFVFNITNQIVLAPAGDKIGKLTARMVKIVEQYSSSSKLNIVKTPELVENSSSSTIEVYPTATIYQISKSISKVGSYFKTKTIKYKNTEIYSEEFDKNKKLDIQSYKGDNWNGKKNKEGEIAVPAQKSRMLDLVKPYIRNLNKWEKEIKTDDEYDAIICALTAYLVDKNGYEKPDKKDIDKFTNSFIYIPSFDEKKD